MYCEPVRFSWRGDYTNFFGTSLVAIRLLSRFLTLLESDLSNCDIPGIGRLLLSRLRLFFMEPDIYCTLGSSNFCVIGSSGLATAVIVLRCSLV